MSILSVAILAIVILKDVTGLSKSLLPKTSARFKDFSEFCLSSQQSLIAAFESEDGGATFRQEPWEKYSESSSTGKELVGHGVTAVIERGNVIEKGATSTTFLSGSLSNERAAAISSRKAYSGEVLAGSTYNAAALSLVLHSKSPLVPTFRADIRYFELPEAGVGWFGGGGDLTPYYLFDDDAQYFHSVYRDVCATHTSVGCTSDDGGNAMYAKMKKWCDDYFYIPARGEHRGVGGIFFDDLESLAPYRSKNSLTTEGNDDTTDVDDAMAFTKAVCDAFLPSYLPIIQQRKNAPYTEDQRHWQLLRRGRYVEFNLLYDRGVKFGLVPGGRTEAVLVSCPPLVAWDYKHSPAEGSDEARLMDILRKPIRWC